MDTQLIKNAVDNRAKKILKANAQIWEYAELAFHEFKSADLLCELLKNEGFVIEKGIAGIPTCFTGTFSYGTGKPVMGILGEYDALSGLNQAAGVPVKREIASGAPGHGCGHSALGAGSLAAAMAVRDYLEICKSDGAPYVKQVKELFERVKEVARGAAIMMGTEMECELSMAFTEYIPNSALAEIANECMAEIGAPEWTEQDYELARQFLFTNNEQVLECAREQIIKRYGEDRTAEILDRPLDAGIHLFDEKEMKLEAGSTDVGDVGYVVPTLNLCVATFCIGTVGHTWQMTAQTNSPIAEKGILTAAKIMALSCVRTMERPEVIRDAKIEVEKRNGGKYTCPLPNSVLPPLETY